MQKPAVAESAVRCLALSPRLSEDEKGPQAWIFGQSAWTRWTDCLAGVVGKWILKSQRLQRLGLRSRQTSTCPRADDAV
jgi:hypothetical protein